MPKHNGKKTRATGAAIKKAAQRDLEAKKAEAIKGGFGQTNRFDPYRNYRFRPG